MSRKELSGDGGGGRQGFTLAELGFGFLAAAIVALTATTLCVSSFNGWLNVSRAVDMQRDAYVAMDSLSRAVHLGTNMAYNGTNFFVYYEQLDGRTNSKFYKDGSDFKVVSPPGATGVTVRGITVSLVYGRLESFNVSLTGNSATVYMVLTNGAEISSNQMTLTRRN